MAGTDPSPLSSSAHGDGMSLSGVSADGTRWAELIEEIRQQTYADPAGSAARAGRAIEEARARGQVDIECQLTRLLGLAHAYQNRPADAASFMQRAVDMARSLGFTDQEATALSSLGAVHAQISDFAAAMACFERAVDLIRNEPETAARNQQMASILNNFGAIQVEMGSPEKAVALFEEAHALYVAANRTFDATLALNNAAGAHAMHAELLSAQPSGQAQAQAHAVAGKASDLARRALLALQEAAATGSATLWARINLARAQTVLGEFDAALKELQRVEDLLADGVERPYFGIEVCTLRARALRLDNQPGAATAVLKAHLSALADTAHGPGDRTLLLKELIASQEADRDLAGALQSFREYHDWTLRVRDRTAELRGQVLNAQLDVERARHKAEVERLRADRLAMRNIELAQEAHVDALTGLPNRRAVDAALALRISDGKVRFACVMVDIDGFKTINDRHSHQAGDEVLRRIGALMRHAIRDGDLAARFGGEEFMLLLDDVDAGTATEICERLRAVIAGQRWDQIIGDTAVTISLGVALRREGEDAAGLVARADACLYAAKAEGRNRVVIDV